jgi:hypothetical protein
MGDPTPTPTLASERPSEPLVYRPLSLPAVAGFGLACLYALVVVIGTAAALIEGAPALLPGPFFPVVVLAGALSLLALWQIRNSEGTRAGAALAQWGLWISILAGLGYGAYRLAASLAVTSQANHFVMTKGEDSGFFPRLLEGDVNTAFLLTQLVRKRDVNPQDQAEMERHFDKPAPNTPQGELSNFRHNDMVRILLQAGKDGQVSPLGVESSAYLMNHYKVRRGYMISTPELSVEVVLTLQSDEPEGAGLGRKWLVVFPPEFRAQTVRLTQLGEKMRRLREKSKKEGDDWLNAVATGQADAIKLLKAIDWERARAAAPAHKEKALEEFQKLLARLGGPPMPLPLRLEDSTSTPWEKHGNTVRVLHPFMLLFSGDPRTQPLSALEGVLPVETADPDADTPVWRIFPPQVTRIIDLPAAQGKRQGPGR